ncbi:unnamed protein product [Strongylus vulgaris]|uniref:Beta-N-acetylhexosaminidase n=1 Tax=Strongylus vulgaris TaxID=40348 RepID=A0A3P7K7Y5_STRVU|nr:unnamed protein product [Strongylus vulgaris]
MHFGGDEVSYDMQQCWLFSIIDNARKGTSKVVWQEVLDMDVPANNSIAHVWKGDNINDIMNEMAAVTANGHKAILSSCWFV